MAEVAKAQIKLQIGDNSFQTGDAYDWTLTHIVDDEFLTPDVPIGRYANIDGGYVKKQLNEPRPVTLYLQSKGREAAQIDAAWLELKKKLTCKKDAILTLYKHGVTRYLYGNLTEYKKRDDSMPWNVPADVKIEFTAPDPWYYGELIERSFQTVTPLLMFPLTIMTDGLTPGLIASGNSMSINYEGDEENGFDLTLTASGAVVNPYVQDAFGNYVKAIVTMASGDVLTIRTGVKPYVRLNGAICQRALLCSFFDLQPGAMNTLTVGADSGVALLAKVIGYKEKYQ